MSAWSALLGKKAGSSVSSDQKVRELGSKEAPAAGAERDRHQRCVPVIPGLTISALACFTPYLSCNFCFSYGFPSSTPQGQQKANSASLTGQSATRSGHQAKLFPLDSNLRTGLLPGSVYP